MFAKYLYLYPAYSLCMSTGIHLAILPVHCQVFHLHLSVVGAAREGATHGARDCQLPA